MKYYLAAIKNYANFNGRARRSEYWYFILFNILFACGAMLLDNLLGIAMDKTGYGPIYLIYTLFVLIPGLALIARRLHDVGKSGWMFLIVFIPLAGAIWMLILLTTDSQPGSNQWGPNPKEVNEI